MSQCWFWGVFLFLSGTACVDLALGAQARRSSQSLHSLRAAARLACSTRRLSRRARLRGHPQRFLVRHRGHLADGLAPSARLRARGWPARRRSQEPVLSTGQRASSVRSPLPIRGGSEGWSLSPLGGCRPYHWLPCSDRLEQARPPHRPALNQIQVSSSTVDSPTLRKLPIGVQPRWPCWIAIHIGSSTVMRYPL